MTTTTAVILARGLGSRMRRSTGDGLDAAQREAAAQGSKAMMPFARPFLDYSLSRLADAGIERAVLVIGPEHQAVRDYFQNTAVGRRVGVEFAVQQQPLGTADAVLAAEAAVRGQTFLVMNGDNLYPLDALTALTQLDARGLASFNAASLVASSNIDAERILKFALLDIGHDGFLLDIQEKPAPDHPLALRPQKWVSMNLWSFTPAIFDACRQVQPSMRGELELQDAVRWDLHHAQARYACVPCDGAVEDLSSQADIERVGRVLASFEPRP
jgi:glucose-1-phosphate thymidylyltransferase